MKCTVSRYKRGTDTSTSLLEATLNDLAIRRLLWLDGAFRSGFALPRARGAKRHNSSRNIRLHSAGRGLCAAKGPTFVTYNASDAREGNEAEEGEKDTKGLGQRRRRRRRRGLGGLWRRGQYSQAMNYAVCSRLQLEREKEKPEKKWQEREAFSPFPPPGLAPEWFAPSASGYLNI